MKIWKRKLQRLISNCDEKAPCQCTIFHDKHSRSKYLCAVGYANNHILFPMRRIVQFSLLCIPIVCMAQMSSCQDAIEEKQPGRSFTPLQVAYAKGDYEADRKWIQLKDDGRNSRLSVFLYLPVMADSTLSAAVLPLTEWQSSHYNNILPKTGEVVAGMAAHSRYDNAVHGIAPGKQFPLFIFGPGVGWLPTDYNNIILPLVRSGVIVAGIAATPVSKSVYFPDGSNSSADKAIADYTACADYLGFAANQLLKLSGDSSSVLFSIIDTSRIIAGGHSVSGASAILAARSNNIIKAIINLDGDVNDAIAALQPVQPVLYITSQPQGVADTSVRSWAGDKSEKRRDARFAYNTALSRNAVRIKVPRMYHSDFLDIAVVKDSLDEKYRKNRFGEINPDLAYAIVVQAMQLFITADAANDTAWASYISAYPGIYFDARKN